MSTFTTNDGVELGYHDRRGDDFALVMLHGLGRTQATFRHQLPTWRSTGVSAPRLPN
jgi:hypothetical protein